MYLRGAVLSVLPAAILTALICGLWAWALKGACGQKFLEHMYRAGFYDRTRVDGL